MQQPRRVGPNAPNSEPTAAAKTGNAPVVRRVAPLEQALKIPKKNLVNKLVYISDEGLLLESPAGVKPIWTSHQTNELLKERQKL